MIGVPSLAEGKKFSRWLPAARIGQTCRLEPQVFPRDEWVNYDAWVWSRARSTRKADMELPLRNPLPHRDPYADPGDPDSPRPHHAPATADR